MSDSPTCRDIAIDHLEFAWKQVVLKGTDSEPSNILAFARAYALIHIGDAINDLVSQGDAR